jgi:hypothetical protein
MTIKLSSPGKMPCYTWSIPAFDTCPGAVIDFSSYDGQLKNWSKFKRKMKKTNQVDACKGCYAQYGHYTFPGSANLRKHNLKDWKRKNWVKDMVKAIKHMPYFRFFDSGDIYCVELAIKIEQIVKACPDTKFWIPTRSHKIKLIKNVIDRLNHLTNCVVRISSDSVIGGIVDYATNSTIVPSNSVKSKPNFLVCQSFNREGKCGDCRACWNKTIKTIAYPAHGIVMKSVLKKLEV